MVDKMKNFFVVSLLCVVAFSVVLHTTQADPYAGPLGPNYIMTGEAQQMKMVDKLLQAQEKAEKEAEMELKLNIRKRKKS